MYITCIYNKNGIHSLGRTRVHVARHELHRRPFVVLAERYIRGDESRERVPAHDLHLLLACITISRNGVSYTKGALDIYTTTLCDESARIHGIYCAEMKN